MAQADLDLQAGAAKSIAGSPTTAQVSVGTSATQIVASGRSDNMLVMTNTGAATVFIGPPGVSITTGHALPAGASITFDFKVCNGAICGIVASGTATVTALRL